MGRGSHVCFKGLIPLCFSLLRKEENTVQSRSQENFLALEALYQCLIRGSRFVLSSMNWLCGNPLPILTSTIKADKLPGILIEVLNSSIYQCLNVLYYLTQLYRKQRRQKYVKEQRLQHAFRYKAMKRVTPINVWMATEFQSEWCSQLGPGRMLYLPGTLDGAKSNPLWLMPPNEFSWHL